MKKFEKDGIWLKTCCRCKSIKTIDLFNKNKSTTDKLNSLCIDCSRKEGKRKYDKKSKTYGKTLEIDLERGWKICNIDNCKHNNKELSLDNFRFDKRQNTYSTICKSCINERSKRYVKRDEFRIKRNEKLREKRKNNPKYREKLNEYKIKNYYKNIDKIKDKAKQKYLENPNKYRERSNNYYKMNKQKVDNANKKYATKPENKAKRKVYCKEWERKKAKNDINYRILRTLRSQTGSYLNGETKSERTMVLAGCSIEEYRKHIESQWENWMNWDNRKNKPGAWCVDHILPLELFDMSDPRQQRICFNYKNQRPLSFEDNIKKSDRLPDNRKARNLSPKEKLDYLISLGYLI